MAPPINALPGSTPVIRMPEVPELDGGNSAPAGGQNFSSALLDALRDAGDAERGAQETAQKFAAGDPSVGIHEAMIATEKASIAVHYAVTLKNKALEAYRELMNTPV